MFAEVLLGRLMGVISKIVWITGASSGIGEALAYSYARQKASLVLLSRNQEKLEIIKTNCLKHTSNCEILAIDLSKVSDIKTSINGLLEKKGIDLLINNAGISQRSLAIETPLNIDREIMEINFFSSVELTKLVLPWMIKRKAGHIAVVSSISGKFGFPLRTAYSASKHALQGYFESLRSELKGLNIDITIISPGRIQTNISYNAITKDGEKHGVLDDGQKNGMKVDECANQIVYAIRKKKKDILIGRKELLLVYIHKFIPSLYYRIVDKIKN